MANAVDSSAVLEEGKKLLGTDPRQAEDRFLQVLAQASFDEDELHDQEEALLALANLYKSEQNANSLAELITKSRGFITATAKAKAAKLIRTLLDIFSDIPGSASTQIQCTKDNIAWAAKEKRVFLRQSLDTKLAGLLIDSKSYREALTLLAGLLIELKRLDDKMVLTEVHLLDSRANAETSNWAKAKAALTAARTAANSIYCPPLLQAQLDMQSGILHAEDKDYKTAYSYFFETFEGYSTSLPGGVKDPKSIKAIKYMLLCKIMLNTSQDVPTLITSKLSNGGGKQIEAMKAIAKAHQDRSLDEFQTVLREYKEELSNDPIIRSHLSQLYDTLLSQNLLRVIEPYSRIEISFVAEKVGQPVQSVETKLSQMILDKEFSGVLDQGTGCLVVFEEEEKDDMFTFTLETIENIGGVVDSLYEKATRLT